MPVEADLAGLTETDLRYFVYGNYIDEPLLMVNVVPDPDVDYYYVHDHLYSPVALLNADGTVAEYYEYNAYGKCYVHKDAGSDGIWLTGDDDIDDHSNLNNPYAFTGRTLDSINNNNYQIMYYRNRYYSTSLSRFLTNDPLGIVPHGYIGNKRFGPTGQYTDGANLYEYVRSNPIENSDPYGLSMTAYSYYSNIGPGASKSCGKCGPDITTGFYDAINRLKKELREAFKEPGRKKKICGSDGIYDSEGWDLYYDYSDNTKEVSKKRYPSGRDYENTVTFGGSCYNSHRQ